MATEKDRKLVHALQRRVAMIDQLIDNDHKFASRDEYCPSQLQHDQPVDRRDPLFSTLNDLLPMTEQGCFNTSRLRGDWPQSFQWALNSKAACDRTIDTLTEVLPALGRTAHHVEEKLTSLSNECQRLSGLSNSRSAAVQAYMRRHNRHQSKVAALLSDAQMKKDTR